MNDEYDQGTHEDVSWQRVSFRSQQDEKITGFTPLWWADETMLYTSQIYYINL